MPTMHCISIPSEDSDDSLFHWDKAVDIDANDYQSQVIDVYIVYTNTSVTPSEVENWYKKVL